MATKYGFHNFCTLVHITEPLASLLVGFRVARANERLRIPDGRSSNWSVEKDP